MNDGIVILIGLVVFIFICLVLLASVFLNSLFVAIAALAVAITNSGSFT